MRVFGQAVAPFGAVQFCELNPAECFAAPMREQRFQATPERLSELDAVNRHVNAIIKPMTDMEIYGVNERWVIPADRGDCEDYGLLKRQILIKRGWPASALLMTVVRDEKGQGHAVLTARTAQGDYILDNVVDELKIWNQTPYDYIMRQSYIDPKVWVSLDPQAYSPVAISVVRPKR
jgi:predicted transglutaminase-like cysteine proteinase